MEKIYRRHDTQHNDTQHNDTQHNDTQHNDTQHNDTQHNNKKRDTQHNGTWHSILLCLVPLKLNVVYAECHKQTHYAECHYAESRGANLFTILMYLGRWCTNITSKQLIKISKIMLLVVSQLIA
jgi:hypothetical protein